MLSQEQGQLEQIKYLAGMSRPPKQPSNGAAATPPGAESAKAAEKSKDKGRGRITVGVASASVKLSIN